MATNRKISFSPTANYRFLFPSLEEDQRQFSAISERVLHFEQYRLQSGVTDPEIERSAAGIFQCQKSSARGVNAQKNQTSLHSASCGVPERHSASRFSNATFVRFCRDIVPFACVRSNVSWFKVKGFCFYFRSTMSLVVGLLVQ